MCSPLPSRPASKPVSSQRLSRNPRLGCLHRGSNAPPAARSEAKEQPAARQGLSKAPAGRARTKREARVLGARERELQLPGPEALVPPAPQRGASTGADSPRPQQSAQQEAPPWLRCRRRPSARQPQSGLPPQRTCSCPQRSVVGAAEQNSRAEPAPTRQADAIASGDRAQAAVAAPRLQARPSNDVQALKGRLGLSSD